jgi:hypothetical protein
MHVDSLLDEIDSVISKEEEELAKQESASSWFGEADSLA